MVLQLILVVLGWVLGLLNALIVGILVTKNPSKIQKIITRMQSKESKAQVVDMKNPLDAFFEEN